MRFDSSDIHKVDRVLTQLDLSDLRDRHPMSLSGGQKQRVAIASAILAGKEILIFDEPTSGLDFRHMERTAELIASLKGKQTVLIVTHDPELIQRCCSHVLLINDGHASLQCFLRENEKYSVTPSNVSKQSPRFSLNSNCCFMFRTNKGIIKRCKPLCRKCTPLLKFAHPRRPFVKRYICKK